VEGVRRDTVKMLTDKDIDGLEEQLNAFKITSSAHNSALEVCLQCYGAAGSHSRLPVGYC